MEVLQVKEVGERKKRRGKFKNSNVGLKER
jgi:hypothetical protein